jgi:stalled ribosome alternative rescue factor ArfA
MDLHQEKLFRKVAKDNNVPYTVVLDIFRKACEKVTIEMGSYEADDKGVKDMDSFKVIHVQNFGKFIPHKQKILASNYQITAKHGREGNK